jgi:adenylate cyclase class IV
MREVELKAMVADPEAARSALRAAGATPTSARRL